MMSDSFTYSFILLSFFHYRALHRIRQKTWESARNCSKMYGLIPRQVKICKQNLDLMATVARASHVSVETCQNQFSDRRWNCSSITNVPNLPKDLVRGTYVTYFYYIFIILGQTVLYVIYFVILTKM